MYGSRVQVSPNSSGNKARNLGPLEVWQVVESLDQRNAAVVQAGLPPAMRISPDPVAGGAACGANLTLQNIFCRAMVVMFFKLWITLIFSVSKSPPRLFVLTCSPFPLQVELSSPWAQPALPRQPPAMHQKAGPRELTALHRRTPGR